MSCIFINIAYYCQLGKDDCSFHVQYSKNINNFPTIF